VSKVVDEDPFCTIIQKLMHAFGDFDCVGNHLTAKRIDKFLKEVWIK